MKLIALLITNNVTTYGGELQLRQVVLFVFAPDYFDSATYDANGYVTGVSYNENTYNYTYDDAGRLLTETKNGVTTTYQYDGYNNIQKTGLTYENGVLKAINGVEIEYDELGNPTKYKGNVFKWEQGRKLVSGSMNGKSFSYAYDGNGMRYEKTVGETDTYYYWNGDQLFMESSGATKIYYIYGATGIEGMIYSVNFHESVYYFDKNTLGDIIALRDERGRIVATYEYDAWGNVTVKDETGYSNTDPCGKVCNGEDHGRFPLRRCAFFYPVTSGSAGGVRKEVPIPADSR